MTACTTTCHTFGYSTHINTKQIWSHSEGSSIILKLAGYYANTFEMKITTVISCIDNEIYTVANWSYSVTWLHQHNQKLDWKLSHYETRNLSHKYCKQEAPLLQRDCFMLCVNWNLVNCHTKCIKNPIWKGVQQVNDLVGHSRSLEMAQFDNRYIIFCFFLWCVVRMSLFCSVLEMLPLLQCTCPYDLQKSCNFNKTVETTSRMHCALSDSCVNTL